MAFTTLENVRISFAICSEKLQFEALGTNGRVLEVRREASELQVRLWCRNWTAPLCLSASAKIGDGAAIVLLPSRIELYIDGELADEEWPTEYETNVELTGATAFSVAPYDAKSCEPPVLGEFENAEGWRPGGGVFVGDCMPYSDGERYHVLYLKDRHHHGSKWGLGAHQWNHISTADFVRWQIHPTAVPITHPEEGSICTGSWIRRGNRQYLFYTVRTCDGSPAPIRRSVSEEGVNFAKDEAFSFTVGECYTADSARDPKVICDADGRYHMFLTTSLTKERRGCLAHLVSEDLDRWTELDEPIYVAPGKDEPECPDYFEWNGWYYLIFSLGGVGQYRYSKRPFDGWQTPGNPTIPCKSVPKMAIWQGRILFAGFEGQGRYGGTMTFAEAKQREDGQLMF